MNLPLFVAQKIYHEQGDNRKVSRPAIHIATAGVAIGLAVMIITVSVVLGFKHTIRDKVMGFGGHIQVHNALAYNDTEPYIINCNDSLIKAIRSIKGTRHLERYSMAQGILKTDKDSLALLSRVWDKSSTLHSSANIWWQAVYLILQIVSVSSSCSFPR